MQFRSNAKVPVTIIARANSILPINFRHNAHSDWLKSVFYESTDHGAKAVTPSANNLF